MSLHYVLPTKYDKSWLKGEDGESELGLNRDAKFTPVSGCVLGTQARAKQIINGKDVASSESVMSEDGVDRTAARLREALGEHKVTVDDNGLVGVTTTGSGLKAANDHEICWDSLLPTHVQDSDDENDAGEQEEKSPGKKCKKDKNAKKTESPGKKGKNAKSPGKNPATVARKFGKASRC